MRAKFVGKLQELFGVTAGELAVVSILFLGLVSGIILRNTVYGNENEYSADKTAYIYHLLDSVADAQATTYIGSDPAGNAFPELALADTVVEKEQAFPKSKKKEMPSDKIDINTASKTELMKLPGVGEKTAITIIEHRAAKKFKKPEDIMDVKGIGIKKFEKMKPFIMVK